MAATAAKSKRAKGGAARSTSAKRRATASKRAAKSAPRRATGKAAVAAVRDVAGRSVRKRVRRAVDSTLPALADAGRDALARVRDAGAVARRARRLPIQRSIDVAVPIDVAWDEWTRFELLPEGTHRVEDIERDGDGHLVGRLAGLHPDGNWEAEILDERIDESFAWHSEGASDCTGLVTFHELAERLTRIELELDVVPTGLGEAAALALRLADRRAEADLRRFKARVEAIDPDDYPPIEDEPE